MESMDGMDREKKLGIILILIGICIPLAAFPFVSGYSKDKGIVDIIYKSAIAIKKEKQGGEESASPITLDKPTRKVSFSNLTPKRIPFRFFLAATLILLYMGFIRIDRSRRRARGEYDKQPDENRPPPVGPEY
jgi:hypothetical protein